MTRMTVSANCGNRGHRGCLGLIVKVLAIIAIATNTVASNAVGESDVHENRILSLKQLGNDPAACSSDGEVFTCVVPSQFESNGMTTSVEATVQCELDAAIGLDFQAQPEACTCTAQLTQEGSDYSVVRDCDCDVCPRGQVQAMSLDCSGNSLDPFLVGPCTSLSCSGQCGMELDLLQNATTAEPTPAPTPPPQTYFTSEVNVRAGPCPNDPNQIGYQSILDVNMDQQAELEWIEAGLAPRTPYVFPFCNNFKFTFEEDEFPLWVYLDDATFVCGYSGANFEQCVIEGNTNQNPQVSIVGWLHNTTNVVFQGLTFSQFTDTSMKVSGDETGLTRTKVTLNDVMFMNFDNKNATAIHHKSGSQVEINTASFVNGTTDKPLIVNDAGTLTVNNAYTTQVEAESFILTTNSGTSDLSEIAALQSSLTRVVQSDSGSTVSVTNVDVWDMYALGSVLFVEGTGSTLVGTGVSVLNNTLQEAFASQQSQNFNVLVAKDFATASLMDVTVENNTGMDRIFSASYGAVVTVTDAVVSNCQGTSPPDLLSSIAIAEDAGSMNLLRLQVSEISWFSAVYFAICGSDIVAKQCCVSGEGDVAAPAFIGFDSTFTSEGNYIDITSLVASRCQGSPDASVFAEVSLDEMCFSETGTGSCEGSCVEGFAESTTCLIGDDNTTYLLTPAAAAPLDPSLALASNPSCPASPPTPAPTPPPTEAAPTAAATIADGSVLPLPNSWPCRAHFQCEPEVSFCNRTRKCAPRKELDNSCDLHEACLSGRCRGGVCQEAELEGGLCSDNEDCFEGYCDGTICAAWKGRDESCVEDYECRTGRCTRNPRVCTFQIYEDSICSKDSDCFGGRCKKEGGLNRCYPRRQNGEECDDNSDCLSLRCDNQICIEPNWLGDACDEPSDCYSLYCRTGDSWCVNCPGPNDATEPEDPQYDITGSATAAFANGCMSESIERRSPGDDPDLP